MTRLLLAALLMLCTAKAGAVAPVGERQDTATITTEQQPDTVKKKKGLINWVLDYLNNTNKNKKNTPDRLELNKYCPFCRKHTVHNETK